jgi:hypothetical protein
MPILYLIQNNYLYIVVGAYKATFIYSLKVETYILLVDIYLDSQVTAF